MARLVPAVGCSGAAGRLAARALFAGMVGVREPAPERRLMARVEDAVRLAVVDEAGNLLLEEVADLQKRPLVFLRRWSPADRNQRFDGRVL
jgi:hypothetical protein